MADGDDFEDLPLVLAKLKSIEEEQTQEDDELLVAMVAAASLLPDQNDLELRLAMAMSSQTNNFENNQSISYSNEQNTDPVDDSNSYGYETLSAIIDDIFNESVEDQNEVAQLMDNNPDIISIIDDEIESYLSTQNNPNKNNAYGSIGSTSKETTLRLVDEMQSTLQKDIDRMIHQRNTLRNEFECKICLTSHNIIDSGSFGCSHLFCRTCLSEFLKSQLDKREINGVVCPSGDCSVTCTENIFREYLPANLIRRYEDCIMLENVEAVEEVSYCPECNYPVECDLGFAMGICEKCSYTFCTSCRKDFHGLQDCNAEEDNKKREEEINRSEELIKRQCKKCPGCKTSIEKDTIGCNHMKCSKCKLDFCWSCLGRLSSQTEIETHYNSQCILFEYDFIDD